MKEIIRNDPGEDIIRQLTELVLYLENKLEEKRNGKEFAVAYSA